MQYAMTGHALSLKNTTLKLLHAFGSVLHCDCAPDDIVEEKVKGTMKYRLK